MYTKNDLNQFESKQISVQKIDKQIANFRRGFPFADLVRPAVFGDGILSLPEKGVGELVSYYDQHTTGHSIVKFVPASGAASRMFKTMYEFLEKSKSGNEEKLLAGDQSFNSAYKLIRNIDRFAFFNDLKSVLTKDGYDVDELISEHKYSKVIEYIVNDMGLGYGSLPKGLLKFHKYANRNRTSLEEHLAEAAEYCRTGTGVVKIHFTVSPEHLEKFRSKVEEASSYFEDKYNLSYDITYSVQKPSTDTIAVDMENNPFRDDDGSILFRPGGHGALIENLNDLDSDIVFIKNIDNVVPDRLKPETVRYKKTIGGLLIRLQQQIFEYLKQMEKGQANTQLLDEVEDFARNEANIEFPASFDTLPDNEKQIVLFNSLNRPIRICGMVKNEGEPGGGPFWVRNSRNQVSLQIVESSQIDMNSDEQKSILSQSTHFNPVDLVCGIRDFKGSHFDLHKFVDPETGFISIKSKGGKNLKAQELPGLWNGAMADWITLFVEVPIITFNPVKTVNDLLRDQHQPK